MKRQRRFGWLVVVSVWSGLTASTSLDAGFLPQARMVGDVHVRIGTPRPGGGYTVTSMPLESYVARVLVGEALPDSEPAALEALAIAVRTYTLANRNRHAADGFDLCDETHCQVMRAATAASERAANATAGRALLRDGLPASIYYSASCGGHTEIPSAVWPGAADPPYLPSQPDDACGGGPMWSAELSTIDLQRAFHAGGYSGESLKNIRIAARNSSGRVGRLRLDGLTPATISGQELRVVVGRTLGWQFIRSTAFELKHDGDRYRFSGHGSGHGVGMCVIGSAHLAAAGQSADEILHRYFPGLTIAVPASLPREPLVSVSDVGRVVSGPPQAGSDPPTGSGSSRATSRDERTRPTPGKPSSDSLDTASRRHVPPNREAVAEANASTDAAVVAGSSASVAPSALPRDVLVSLPDGDEGQRVSITDLTVRARADLARLLNVPQPVVSLRFHPTIDSYERSTHEPWFTSSATVGDEIHLLPPSVLRERGILDRTIRQELAHAMTKSTLAGRPAWVREGAALYFADMSSKTDQTDTSNPRSSRAKCPDDAELLRPVSVGALTNAYSRAQACFGRQIAQGRSWRDVR